MKKPCFRYDCVNNDKRLKEELLRIVVTPAGTVEVDPTGKMNGRGAYLYPNRSTLEIAKKNHRLERSLGVKIPEEVYIKIGRYLID